ncbi:MAG: gliding motility-associated C-terminal domain-containing protein, partial [Cryomorphaceae bacterium]
TCTQPCVPPLADGFIVDGDTPDSITVCVGEPVTFDASASAAANGFNIEEYSWNFVDGTIDNTTGAVITHSFDNVGYYDVQLTLTDDNPGSNCQNLNVVPLKVYVSNYPTFYDFPSDTTICVGEPVDLIGITNFGQYDSTWTGFPSTNIIDDGCLPDTLLGISQSINITYTEFDPSAVITSPDDLQDICINMEHSFMGDLVVQLSCPDGTTINLQEQGGGGTQIGVPDQADNVDCVNGTGIGEGWTYCWTADATQTWTEWVDAQGGFGNTLPEGSYASVDPLDDLVGCPLQGTWQITVIDNWAADDGTIFEFGVTFDPSFYPDLVEFTNTVGEDADSSFWNVSDPYVISSSPDLNQITVQPTEVGSYSYNYQVVNNFGCEFDSTVTITVVDPPQITAGPDLSICNDPATLQAGLEGVDGQCSQDAGNYSYCYSNGQNLEVTYCPDNPGDGVTFMQLAINSGSTENGFDEFFVYDGPDSGSPLLAGPLFGDLSGLSFVATNPGGCITFQITPDGSVDCQGGSQEELNVSVSCGGGGNLIWSWSPTTGISDPNIQNPTVFVDQETVYTVSAYMPGMEGCVGTDQVLVAPDADANPGVDNDTTLCYNNAVSLLTSYLGGSPAQGGEWIDNATGAPFPTIEFNPIDYPEGANFDLTYTVSNGVCTNSANLSLNILPATNSTCCQTNANAGPDAVACALTYQLQGDIPVGIGTWSGPPEVTFSDVNDPEATISAPSPGGTYELTFTDFNGSLCEDSDIVQVILADSLEITVVPEDAICFNECSGTAIAIPSGGTSSTGLYSLEWSGGAAGGANQLRDSLCLGSYSVKVTDNVGCVDSTFFEIGQPEPMDMSILGRGALCKDSCNARITISSPDAIEYTYNGGIAWETDSIGFVCPDTVATVGIRNEFGCEIYDSLTLDNPEAYLANFNINPNPTTVKNPLISFQDVSRPGPIAKTLFLYGDPAFAESDSRLSQYRFPADTAGEYLITLISESVNGCIDTTSKVLVINDDLLWFIPNSFSPNGDGINDIWKPVGTTVDLTSYSCKIYDRWGRLVFQTSDIDQGWNGATMESEYFSDTDIYTYVLEITSATTEDKYELTGFITMIR